VTRMAWKALDSRVLVVAIEGAVGDWAAYIGAINSQGRHEDALQEVAGTGTKIPQGLAEYLFPKWKELRWRE